MSNTNALLDKARDLCVPPTDYRLSKMLGISSSTIARCRRRNGTLDNQGVYVLAKFLQQDFEHVLALVEIDRAKNEDQRAFWENIAPRLVSSLVIGVFAATSYGVSTSAHSAPAYDVPRVLPAIHYAKLLLRLASAVRRFAVKAISLHRGFLAVDLAAPS